MPFDIAAEKAALRAELDAQMLDPKWDGKHTAAQELKMAQINAELFRLRKQANYRKQKYGVNRALYDAMSKNQERACMTCRRHETAFARGLVIDHDHATHQVRGLLCPSCNSILGHALENPQTLRNLADYLDYWAKAQAPKS